MTIDKNIHQSLEIFFEEKVRIPNSPCWIFLCGYAIGETTLFCALAKEFRKTHGHDIILLVMKKHFDVAKMYQHNFVKIIVIEDKLMHLILRSGFIPQDRLEINQPISPCWIDRGFRDSDGIKYIGRYPGRGGISESDMMRFVLKLPWNSKLEKPIIAREHEDSAWVKARSLGLRVGRSVLLCPINNSAEKFPDIFWITLAQKLKELDFTVFTNMGGLNKYNGLEEMPIKYTTPVNLSINEVIPFSHYAGRVITGGNGMSFLTMLGCSSGFNMTQILPYSNNKYENHLSLGYINQRDSLSRSTGIDLRSAFQYMAPELCVNNSISEYFIPFNGDTYELQRLANVIATQDRSDPSLIQREDLYQNNEFNKKFDWLNDLIQQ